MAQKTAPSFDTCKAEYNSLWTDCEIRPDRRKVLEGTARKIISNRPRYETVSRLTGVPWFVIGLIHQMECSLSFAKHIHNGDPLTDRTKLVPAGRPKVWPPSGQDPWEASAVDALTMPGKEFHKIKDWSIERIAYALELYNGFGYRLYRNIHSPYLWSFTTHYASGKYVSDGNWSKTAVSGQSGAMALLKVMMEIAPLEVDVSPQRDAAAHWPKAPGPEAPSRHQTTPLREGAKSTSVWSLLVAFFAGVINFFTAWLQSVADMASGWVSALPGISGYVTEGLAPLTSLSAALKIDITKASIGVAGALIVIAIVRHSRDKAELVNRRQSHEQQEGV